MGLLRFLAPPKLLKAHLNRRSWSTYLVLPEHKFHANHCALDLDEAVNTEKRPDGADEGQLYAADVKGMNREYSSSEQSRPIVWG